ncbi:hypothetical protein PT974_11952 [Cladobotryum mycophilum]|uniref:DNA-binding protein RAP1 n=1 Tax=Cladobotryum mycophilum TaxID=491253 RepID=A0ABR0S6M1_9HYPO
MASGITYDGVPRSEGGGGGGNIFRGVCFWLSRNLPARRNLVNIVENNGGKVVPQEKDAHILIADHVRKDVPAGSYSFKFILDSVRNGIIQLKDKYRIGPDPDLPRPIGSSRGVKGSRTPFTPEDDAVLANWILSHPGAAPRGNKIYMELERINDRHTWQSWKNKFVKTLMMYSREHLEALAEGAVVMTNEQETRRQANATRSGPSKVVESPREKRQETRTAPVNTSRPGPSRTSEWAREQQQDMRATAVVARNDRPPRPKARTSMIIPEPEQEDNEDSEEVNVAGQHAITKTKAISRMETVSNDDAVSKEDSRVDENVPELDEDVVTIREQFYRDLQSFVEDYDANIELEFNIDGEDFEIWDLFLAVSSQNLPSEEVDWIKVAEDLGFDWASSEVAIDSLQQYYGVNLAEFVDIMAGFAQEMEEAEEEKASEDSQLDEEFEEAAPVLSAGRPSTQSYMPSSPPMATTSRKRALEVPLLSSWRSPKRRRLSHNLEIPATPDADDDVERNRFSDETPSPSLRITHGQPRGSSVEQGLPLLRKARDEKRPEIEPMSDPFVSTPVRPVTPARRQTQETPYDITPSQQLHSEAHDIDAIPLRMEEEKVDEDGSSPPGSSDRQTGETETPPDSDEEPMQTTSPSTLKALPKKRKLPASFKPLKPASPQRQPLNNILKPRVVMAGTAIMSTGGGSVSGLSITRLSDILTAS